MLDKFMSWFDKDDDTVEQREGCTKRAVCLLLVSAARADGEFRADEAREIARLVSDHFGLAPEETAELVAMAAGDDSMDLYPAARLLNENFTQPQRQEVLELMWRVVYSDGLLEAREDTLMRRVAKLLDISHHDLIALKFAARHPREER